MRPFEPQHLRAAPRSPPTSRLLSERAPGQGGCRRGSLRARQQRAEEAGLSRGVRARRSAQKWSLSPARPPPGRDGGSCRSRAPGPRSAPALGGRRSRPGPAAHLRQPRGAPGPRLLQGERPARGQQRRQQHHADEETPRPGRRGIVSLAALLRSAPPRLPSGSRASLRARPRLLQGRERADRGGARGSAGGPRRRGRETGGRGGARGGGAAPFSGQRPGRRPPFPEGRLLGAPGESRPGGRLPLIWPPPALCARRYRRRGPKRIPGRGGGVAALPPSAAAPAGLPPRGRADDAGALGAPAARGSPQLLGKCLFVPRGRFARGRRPGSHSPKAPPATLPEVEPGEAPATLQPISSGCSQSTSKSQRDLRLRCEGQVPEGQPAAGHV